MRPLITIRSLVAFALLAASAVAGAQDFPTRPVKLVTPYASGGAYLNRMTQHCKGCAYDPKKRVGQDACPFTTLYWDFLDRHRDAFVKNHRMSQQVHGLNRLTDLPELRLRAQQVLAGLDEGTI